MFGDECENCICMKCRHRIDSNCCELCIINKFPSSNRYCDNDDILIGDDN